MYGLKDIEINNILEVLANCRSVNKAILYGSRAKGNYRNGSDIDLCLVGDALDLTMLLKILIIKKLILLMKKLKIIYTMILIMS